MWPLLFYEMYGAVREGGRARDFEEAIEWLVSAGILNRTYNVSKMEHPLPAFDKLDQFKLFVFDTGLLKHMAGIDNAAILLKSDYQFKGLHLPLPLGEVSERSEDGEGKQHPSQISFDKMQK